MKRGQVSVRAEVYERLRAAASKRGLSISQIVEAAVSDALPWPNTDGQDRTERSPTVDQPRAGG